MKIRRTTRITIEQRTVRTVSIDQTGSRPRYCEQCGGTSAEVTPAGASAILRVSDSELDWLIRAGEIHFVETERGTPSICGHSLMTAVNTVRLGPKRKKYNKE